MRGFNAKSSYTHLVLVNCKARVPSYPGISILQVCYFHKKGRAPNTSLRVCTFPRALLCQTSMSATPISEAKTLPGRLCYTWDDMKCNAHYNYPKSMQMCQYLDFVLTHRLSGGMESPPPCVELYQISPILWRNCHLHPLHLW